MKKILLGLFFCFCFNQFVFSQQHVDATGETELYEAYDKSDKELNKVYNQLKKKLGTKDQAALVAAQKDWIKFRDSNCKFKSYPEGYGGVIGNKMYADCRMQLTLARTKELKSLLKGF